MGVRGDLAAASHEAVESEVERAFTFGPGMGKWRVVVPLVGESPGVEQHEPEGGRGVRKVVVVVGRSVEVEAERELLDPLGYGAGCVDWVDRGDGGRQGRSSPTGRDMLRCPLKKKKDAYYKITRRN